MADAPDAPATPPPEPLQTIKEYVLWIHDPPGERIPTASGWFKFNGGVMQFFRATTPFPVPNVGDEIRIDLYTDGRSDEERARALVKNRRVVVRVEHHIEVKESGIVHNLNVHTKLEPGLG